MVSKKGGDNYEMNFIFLFSFMFICLVILFLSNILITHNQVLEKNELDEKGLKLKKY